MAGSGGMFCILTDYKTQLCSPDLPAALPSSALCCPLCPPACPRTSCVSPQQQGTFSAGDQQEGEECLQAMFLKDCATIVT